MRAGDLIGRRGVSFSTRRPSGAVIDNPVAWALATRGPGVHIALSTGETLRLTEGHVVPLHGETTVDCPAHADSWDHELGVSLSGLTVPRTERMVLRAVDVREGDRLSCGGTVISTRRVLGMDAVRIWLAEPGYIRTVAGAEIGTRHHEVSQCFVELLDDDDGDIVAIEHHTFARGGQIVADVPGGEAHAWMPHHAQWAQVERMRSYRSGMCWLADSTGQSIMLDRNNGAEAWVVGSPAEPASCPSATVGDSRVLTSPIQGLPTWGARDLELAL